MANNTVDIAENLNITDSLLKTLNAPDSTKRLFERFVKDQIKTYNF